MLGRIGAGGAAVASGAGLLRTADELASSAAAPKPRMHEIALTASEFEWALMDDTTVRVWGYNGQMPGPEIRVREGDHLRITLKNELSVPTTIHWHGINVPNAMDGVAGLTQAPVDPGSSFVYEFDASPAGSRWYHSHTDPQLQVAMGLYGSFIIEPRSGGTAYDHEFTYMMTEWDAELTPEVAAGMAPRGGGDKLLRGGELGADYFLLNGRMHGAVPPMIVKTGDHFLIRLCNTGNMPHAFHTHGHSFTIVATDGNPVPKDARLIKDTVLIGPAERYDLALTANNPGVWMVHCHMENHMANGMMTLLVYEGYMPPGPAGDFFTPIAGTPAAGKPEASTPGMDMGTEIPATPAASTTSVAAAVSMVDDRFVPNTLTVAVGATVVWTNNGQDWHDIASLDGSFASGRLDPGQTFSHAFDHTGTYKYICKHHFMQGMTGQVTVK